MPNTTTNLGLTTWLETDIVDFDDLNDNFEIIDGLIESGTVTSSYTGGTSGTTTWRYKKYHDGTVEICTKIELTTTRCNTNIASSPIYYSEAITVSFPSIGGHSFASAYYSNVHLASNTFGWASNTSNTSIINSLTFRLFALENEGTTGTKYKQVFICVRGVLA